eukprot:7361725-Ditylum_brightwellii.AAC.1
MENGYFLQAHLCQGTSRQRSSRTQTNHPAGATRTLRVGKRQVPYMYKLQLVPFNSNLPIYNLVVPFLELSKSGLSSYRISERS